MKITMNKVVHFELPGDDLTRMKEFYGNVFDWQMEDIEIMDTHDSEYTAVLTVKTDDNKIPIEPGAINGGILKRSDQVKVPTFFISVSDIDEKVKVITAKGETIIKEKSKIGNMGYVAYFKDTEDNVLSLWQEIK